MDASVFKADSVTVGKVKMTIREKKYIKGETTPWSECDRENSDFW